MIFLSATRIGMGIFVKCPQVSGVQSILLYFIATISLSIVRIKTKATITAAGSREERFASIYFVFVYFPGEKTIISLNTISCIWTNNYRLFHYDGAIEVNCTRAPSVSGLHCQLSNSKPKKTLKTNFNLPPMSQVFDTWILFRWI